ncbi:MAG TPA: alanine racemase [Thermomicrobiales bacterium]|nr:alanine racemase [Thermomicrobiales bacterium]
MAAMLAETALRGLEFVRDHTDLDTPCLVVDESRLQANIAEMASFAASAGVGLRPHIKTHKTPEIARLQLAAGAVGLTCAKLGEAEIMVGLAGADDVLLAYPTVGETKIARLLALMERARITVALDSREAGRALCQAMAAQDRILDVYVEVNTGQDRAGAHFGDEAVSLAKDLARIPGLRVIGIMTHEGQANAAEPDQLESVALEAGRAIVATAEAIRAAGIDIQEVSVGSTPAAKFTPTVPGVTEMRPGTYVFNDNSAFRHGRTGPEDCALHILATVVSRPAPDRAVIDAGSKTLTMDPSKSHPGHGYIVGHPNARIARISEEHGVVLLPEGEDGFHVGHRVEIIPNHVCPAVNLQDQLFILRDGRLADVWDIAARGKVR